MSAPTTAPPRQPLRHLQLNLKRLDTGEVQVSTPQAREFFRGVRNPDQLWHAVMGAFHAAQAAGQAAWLGDTEVDGPRPTRPAVPREGVSWSRHAAARPDLVATEDWLPLWDGSWLSPSGKRYRAASVVNPVIARRAALGLPTTWESQVARMEQIQAAAAEVGEAARFWERVDALGEPSRWHTSDARNRQVAS